MVLEPRVFLAIFFDRAKALVDLEEDLGAEETLPFRIPFDEGLIRELTGFFFTIFALPATFGLDLEDNKGFLASLAFRIPLALALAFETRLLLVWTLERTLPGNFSV